MMQGAVPRYEIHTVDISCFRASLC